MTSTVTFIAERSGKKQRCLEIYLETWILISLKQSTTNAFSKTVCHTATPQQTLQALRKPQVSLMPIEKRLQPFFCYTEGLTVASLLTKIKLFWRLTSLLIELFLTLNVISYKTQLHFFPKFFQILKTFSEVAWFPRIWQKINLMENIQQDHAFSKYVNVFEK